MSFSPGKAPPFWDDPGIDDSITPNIITALPESPNDPWPDHLSAWDTIKLAGMRAPGIPRVTGGRGKRFNPQVTPGLNGHVPNFYGYDCAEFTIRLRIWTKKQHEWLYGLISLIMPPASSKIQPVAIKVDYPGLRMLNITDCYVVHVGIPKLQEDSSVICEIPCVEYLLPTGTGPGPLQPATEVVTNADGTMTVRSKTPPPDPSTTSIGP